MFARVLGPPPANRSIGGDTPSYVQTLVRTSGDDTVWPWVTGAFDLTDGSGRDRPASLLARAAAFMVSTLGWLTAFKGLALLTFPEKLRY